MSKFKRKLRYDHSRADKGIWIEAEDVGYEFLVRFVDPTLDRVALELKKIRKSREATLNVKKLSDDEAAKCLICEYALLDWRNIEDEKGNPVPFSVENAYEFFSDENELWIINLLAVQATDVDSYKPVDDAKN